MNENEYWFKITLEWIISLYVKIIIFGVCKWY